MSSAIAAGIVVLAVSAAGSGALLVRTRARLSGAFFLLFSLALVGSTLSWNSSPRVGEILMTVAWTACLTAALLAYPTPRWGEPLGFVLWVTVMAASAMTVLSEGRHLFGGAIIIGTALVGDHLWRYERSTDVDRMPLLWMAFAASASSMLFFHSAFLLDNTVGTVVGLVVSAFVPLACVIGILRPRIVDVRGLIIEAVVFEVAVLAYISIFTAFTATIDLAGASPADHIDTLAIVGAVAAAGFYPLRLALRGVVDELLFGNRPDPLDAATKVADQVGDDPELALAVVREAMVLPYASLVVGGEELASSGTPVPHSRRLPLAMGDDTVGEIIVGLRSGDLRLSAADERVLRIVAPLLAQTLRARSLASDLKASRGQAINAIEEERRRLRRDLHDGLGPTLSGIAFTADAARNSLDDPGAADSLLRTLRGDAANAVAEIRRLVYDMRPPALDELGLVGALRQWALQTRTAEGRPLAVDIRAPEELRDLPAAVEVAAYRIAVEALTNTARHSGSDRATVRLARTGDQLTIDVHDHGTAKESWRAGVGLASMNERASAIGGTLTARPTPTGGHVNATLPIS